MKQHTIAGHFSHLDRLRPTISNDEISTVFNLVLSKHRLGYGIGHAFDDLSRLGIYPSEIGLDLLILAIHVYAADTRISRSTESQDGWSREIKLIVPVSDPARWTNVTNILKRMLDFLTGDRWSFEFRPRPQGFGELVPTGTRRLGRLPYGCLALFSGGLDSLIGAINSFEFGDNPLLISHAGDSATSDAQDKCYKELERHYKDLQPDRLRLWLNIPKRFVQHVGSEPTTRGRSFLFFSIGVFAGTGFDDAFKLRAPENGLIAINVPLDPLRLGALSTRTMHPFYLSRWNELMENLGIPGYIENPYWDKTKGEMVSTCANQELLYQLIPQSLSCSSPSKGRWQGRGIEHCGYCLPCIIRRAAIEKAIGQDPTTYFLADMTSHTLDTRQVEGRQVRSFQFLIDRLHSQPSLAKLLIHKPGPLSDLSDKEMKILSDVYQRGMAEVAMFLSSVRT